MKSVRLVVLLVCGIVLIGGALVYKTRHNGARSQEFHGRAVEMVRSADAYKQDPDYITRLMEAAFPEAAKQGNGGALGAADEDRYFNALFQAMVDQAVRDGKKDVAVSLRNFAVGKKFLEVKVKS